MEQLEDRTMLSTVTWINPAGGDWDVPGNWNTGALPGPADDVLIDVSPVATISHSKSILDAVRSVTADDPLTLSNGTLNVTGSLSDTGAVTLAGGTLANATVPAGTALLSGYNTTSTLKDVTLAGTLTFAAAGGGNVSIVAGAGLTLAGATVTMPGSGDILAFSGTQTLGGIGTVDIPGTSGLSDSGAGKTLTIAPGVTVEGGGSASINVGTAALDNQGTISGDVGSDGYPITVTGTAWVNHGTIRAVGGGYIVLAGSWTNAATGTLDADGGIVNPTGTWSNLGTIDVTNKGILALSGNLTLGSLGTLDRTPTSTGAVELTGTLDLTGQTLDKSTGPWTLDGGTILGGTVTDDLLAAQTTSTLKDVTLAGTLTPAAAGGGTVSVVDIGGAGLTLAGGSVVLKGDAESLAFAGTQTLAGTGTVSINGFSGLTDSGVGKTLTIAAGVTVHGGNEGFINAGTASLDNLGTISGDISGNLPSLNITGTNWVNDGTIQATLGGDITLAGSWTNAADGHITASGGVDDLAGSWKNAGVIDATGGMIDFDGTFKTSTLGTFGGSGGTINFTGTLANDGTLSLDGAGISPEYALAGGTIIGGTVSTPHNGELVATQAGGTLDGATLSGSLLVGQVLNTYVNVKDGLTLAASTITMEGNAALNFGGTQSLGGSGTLNYTDSNSQKGIFVPKKGDTLTIGANVTIHGVGGTVGSASAGTLSNNGTIDSDGGGSIVVQGFSNFAAGILAGGTWEAANTSTLYLIGASIVTNAATLILDGATSHIYSDSSATNALAGYSSNLSTGHFTVQNSAKYTPPSGTFSNAGAVIVGALGAFAATQYTQTGGSTTLQKGTLGSAASATINIQGGTLSGPGTVDGNLTNSGEVDLGSSPGTLVIDGNYSQSLSGNFPSL